MKLFLNYLRQYRAVLIFFILSGAVFSVSFVFYRLPVEAVLYPFALCALFGAAALIFGFFRKRKRLSRLCAVTAAKEPVAETVRSLPPSADSEQEALRGIIVKLCEEKAAAAADSKRQLGDMIDYYTLWVHQIKTPIAAMRLRLQSQDNADSRALLRELSRVERYVEMVLCYLRLSSETTDYVFRECDMDKIIRSAVKKFSGEFISRGIKMRCEPAGMRVLTDEKWLGFVIEQLLSNALKYTNEGEISVYFEPDRRALCVKDTGIGIAAEDLPRIFEKGYTGLNGRGDLRASGIGLYLSRKICRNLNHSLRAESVLGEGTEISVCFADEQLTKM
mgnify:FL=1